MLSNRDPRGFRDDVAGRKGDRFRIAWIGGSSLKVRKRKGESPYRWLKDTYIPVEVRNRLEEKWGRKVDVVFYFADAQRIFDSYLCLLHSLEQNPDLIVLTVNPFWSFNDKAVSFRSHLFESAPVSAWPWILQLGRPADLIAGRASLLFRVVRDRLDIHRALFPSFLDVDSQPAQEEQSSENKHRRVEDLLSLSQPIVFWVHHEHWSGQDRADVVEWQRAAMHYGSEDAQGMSNVILESVFETLAEAEIPALVYMSPVSFEVLSDDLLSLKLAAAEAILAGHKSVERETGLKVLSDNPTHVLPGVKFRDLLHPTDVQPLSSYLVGEIQKIIDARRRAEEDEL